mmetsp:Transcript_84096/g.132412  ORF Transcript_84096/g.132412 Transcript_84096/m.132412 type:complete len:165 (+) Transcript_84096:76-570(+)
MTSSSMQCTRCHSTSHSAKDCPRPFFRTRTAMEEREDRLKRRSEWEARQAEKAEKQAAWEERRKKQMGRPVVVSKHFDGDDDAVSTAASSVVVVDEEEVERMASLDKEVRKLSKVLREIEKLELRSDLDALQKAKVARKHDVELELITAKGLAKARARKSLRHA